MSPVFLQTNNAYVDFVSHVNHQRRGHVASTRHIVEECPLTAFPGGLQRLHKAGPDAVEWLSRLSLKL